MGNSNDHVNEKAVTQQASELERDAGQKDAGSKLRSEAIDIIKNDNPATIKALQKHLSEDEAKNGNLPKITIDETAGEVGQSPFSLHKQDVAGQGSELHLSAVDYKDGIFNPGMDTTVDVSTAGNGPNSKWLADEHTFTAPSEMSQFGALFNASLDQQLNFIQQVAAPPKAGG